MQMQTISKTQNQGGKLKEEKALHAIIISSKGEIIVCNQHLCKWHGVKVD